MKQIIFDGHKFTKDEKTGYYLKTTKPRKRLHIYVWEYHNGCEVPKGYEIHHKDLDKDNNDISNLMCVPSRAHKQLHGALLTDKQREARRKTINEKARPKANEWHGSDQGREWHKEQYKNTLGKYNAIKIKKKCEYCGANYETVEHGNNRFCSNKCKSAWRRESGLDDVERICEYCGKTFKTNKYKPTKYCSSLCASKGRVVTGSKRTLL